ncbi:hypothetical protein Tco_0028882 [Tanacetum coccineum]
MRLSLRRMQLNILMIHSGTGDRQLEKEFGLSARVVSSEDEGLGEEDASKQGRKIHDIDADEDITLENVHDEDMFSINDLDGDEVVVESEVADKDVNLSVDDFTLAQALATLKSAKVQEKGMLLKSQVQEKSKGKMNEPEHVKKLSKNDQLRLDEELAFGLQAKVEAEYQLAQRLHDEEQEQYTDEEKAKFFCEFLDQRRKFFAAKRAKAKRKKPPTQA